MATSEAAVLRRLALRRLWLAGGLLLLLVVMVLALLPGSALPELGASDKLLHLLSFAFLMVWFAGIVQPRHFWLLALALLAYGGLMELLQSFTTYRQAEVGDLLADALGILLGWLLAACGLQYWCDWLERGWQRLRGHE